MTNDNDIVVNVIIIIIVVIAISLRHKFASRGTEGQEIITSDKISRAKNK